MSRRTGSVPSHAAHVCAICARFARKDGVVSATSVKKPKSRDGVVEGDAARARASSRSRARSPGARSAPSCRRSRASPCRPGGSPTRPCRTGRGRRSDDRRTARSARSAPGPPARRRPGGRRSTPRRDRCRRPRRAGARGTDRRRGRAPSALRRGAGRRRRSRAGRSGTRPRARAAGTGDVRATSSRSLGARASCGGSYHGRSPSSGEAKAAFCAKQRDHRHDEREPAAPRRANRRRRCAGPRRLPLVRAGRAVPGDAVQRRRPQHPPHAAAADQGGVRRVGHGHGAA